MGLSRAAIGWLIEEAQRRPFEGTILTLGVQNVAMTPSAFESLAHRMGAILLPKPQTLPAPLVTGHVTANEVFLRLGFERVMTTDVDGFEGCDLVFDLNADHVPEGHAGAYDMVLDAGTFEHVFHLPNAFRNVVAFAKPGGRIVHHAPSSNHIDHGFYMFSPTLFWDFYAANGMAVPRFDLVRYRFSATEPISWDVATYRAGALNKFMFGGLGGGCFGVALVAEKTDAIGDILPQQGLYAQAWSDQTTPGLDHDIAAKAGHMRNPWKMLLAWLGSMMPVDWRLRWRAARRPFPLKIRRRF